MFATFYEENTLYLKRFTLLLVHTELFNQLTLLVRSKKAIPQISGMAGTFFFLES